MSSTNRGGKRSEADFYPTPYHSAIFPFFEALAENHIFNSKNPPWREVGSDWLEPCAGMGDLIAGINVWNHESLMVYRPEPRWTALELRAECRNSLLCQDDVDEVTCPQDFLEYDQRHDLIITNPPFSLAMPIIEHALTLAPVVVMLLRVGFAGSKSRYQWHQKHPSDLYVLASRGRPSFTAKGSDSSEYAWFTWGLSEGGHWYVV